MIFYRLTDRTFSRRWRRNKDYTEQQLAQRVKRRGCTMEKFKGGLRVKERGGAVVNFEAILHEDAPQVRDAALSLYASLRNPSRGRITVHTVRSAVSVVKAVGEP